MSTVKTLNSSRGELKVEILVGWIREQLSGTCMSCLKSSFKMLPRDNGTDMVADVQSFTASPDENFAQSFHSFQIKFTGCRWMEDNLVQIDFGSSLVFQTPLLGQSYFCICEHGSLHG
jgi:hypothetical protein